MMSCRIRIMGFGIIRKVRKSVWWLSKILLNDCLKSYIEKMWTNHERKFAIQEMMKSENDYILPIKIDNLSIPGIPDTIGDINLAKRNPNSICEVIMKKIGNPQFIDPQQLKKMILKSSKR